MADNPHSYTMHHFYKRFLGYRKGADGTPEIVPEEAEIILRIYSDFISGKAPSTIARELTRDGILTPGGKTEWEKKVVLSMLTELTELEAPPIEFDEKLWHAVVERVTVYNDDRLVYSLKDGSEITVML